MHQAGEDITIGGQYDPNDVDIREQVIKEIEFLQLALRRSISFINPMEREKYLRGALNTKDLSYIPEKPTTTEKLQYVVDCYGGTPVLPYPNEYKIIKISKTLQ